MRRGASPLRASPILALRCLLAAVLVLGLARAGSAYYVCAELHAVMSGPCCGRHPAHGMCGDATVDRAPCCSRVRQEALPSATTLPEAAVPSAPLVATLDQAELRGPARDAVAAQEAGWRSRAGPPPGDTSPFRLMVLQL